MRSGSAALTTPMRPLLFRLAAAAGVLVVAAAVVQSPPGRHSLTAQTAPPPASRIVIGSTQQVLINQDRAANGLPPLTWNGCLARIAAQNAARMAYQGFVSHTNGPSLDLGCGLGSQAGENVGYWSLGIN